MPEQWKEVACILGINEKGFLGGIERCDFSVAQLSTILDMGFISLDYKSNNTPTVGTFYEFGKMAESKGAIVVFLGFLESQNRKDARLIIEGVEVKGFNDKVDVLLDFSQKFHRADEFTANAELLRAWYD